MASTLSADTRRSNRVQWRHSLVFRVALLCTVLFLCLLGSVYVITRHYFNEVVNEMRLQVARVADSVELALNDNPDADLSQVSRDLSQTFGDADSITLEPFSSSMQISPFTWEQDEQGHAVKVARMSRRVGGRQLLVTVRVAASPQMEIVRAFKNKYLAALTALFLVALGLMIYFIVESLRPLRELSESCARIAEGQLRDVAIRNNYGEILALENTFNTMVASLREKELVESNLRQAQRLSALGTLAAGVAHDIRNPLNAIKLLAGHTLDTIRDTPEAGGAARQIETIRNEVDRLEDIVSGFLSLAREHELRPQPCRVDAVLGECLGLIGKDAEDRKVRIVAELRAGDTTLLLDPKQWRRAVLNVLINALEACPAGGRVRVFSRLTDTHCEIEVRDDGAGMSKDTTERAFDPYFTTKSTGTGLGLSITRGIIEEHGGTISLTSSEGQGCQVLISIPLDRTPS